MSVLIRESPLYQRLVLTNPLSFSAGQRASMGGSRLLKICAYLGNTSTLGTCPYPPPPPLMPQERPQGIRSDAGSAHLQHNTAHARNLIAQVRGRCCAQQVRGGCAGQQVSSALRQGARRVAGAPLSGWAAGALLDGAHGANGANGALLNIVRNPSMPDGQGSAGVSTAGGRRTSRCLLRPSSWQGHALGPAPSLP